MKPVDCRHLVANGDPHDDGTLWGHRRFHISVRVAVGTRTVRILVVF